jgi:hypothetical protein
MFSCPHLKGWKNFPFPAPDDCLEIKILASMPASGKFGAGRARVDFRHPIGYNYLELSAEINQLNGRWSDYAEYRYFRGDLP